MRKISEIIQSIVSEQVFLEEALHFNFLNLTAFSEYILPYVQKETHKEVSIHAIKMALSRMQKPEGWAYMKQYAPFQRVTTRRGLSILTLSRSPKSIEIVTNLMSERRKRDTKFFTVVEWLNEIDIIFESINMSIIQEKIPQSLQILMVSWLSLVSCELSDAEISTPWLFYRVTKKLAFHGINIIQVLSTYHELGIILNEQDTIKAFTVLLD